jgi:thiol-disulfide isomerase/thioredoxin
MPKPGRQFLIRIALFAVLAIAGTYQYRKYRVAPDIAASSLWVETLEGKAFTIVPGTDGPLIVKFFATWCIDCRRELPDLKSKAELFKRYNIQVILLSDEARDDLSFFAEREALPFSIYRLPKKFKEYGIYTLPTTYIFNKNGDIFSQYTGNKEITEDILQQL